MITIATRCAISTVVLAAMIGCGGAPRIVGDPWKPGEAKFFDDGVDIVDDHAKLSGQFQLDEADTLEGRCQLADVIAVIEVTTVQLNKDVDGNESRRIVARFIHRIYGTLGSSEVDLMSAASSPGFPLLERHERRLEGRHVLFLRLFRDDEGQLAHHFHLSPASDPIIAEVKRQVSLRKDEEERAASAKARGGI